MNEKLPPKYQIDETIPLNKERLVPNKKLLKKLEVEWRRLNKERIEWEKIVEKVDGYQETIKILERKRKDHENEIRDL